MPNLANLPAADLQAGAALWNTGFKNYLINGDFAINQSGFGGGALAAGIYGFDRWKAGTGGCTISLSSGVLTHTSGPLVQVIEAPNLAGKTITVSVDGLSGGSLNVNVEGVTGVIAASAVRAGVTLVVPSTSTGNVTVTLTPASGAVTYKRVQVEVGSAATGFEWRPAAAELALCVRYFFRLKRGGGFAATTTRIIMVCEFSTMQAPPAVTASSTITVTNTVADYSQSVAGITAAAMSQTGGQVYLDNFSGLTVGSYYAFHGTTGGSLLMDAEL